MNTPTPAEASIVTRILALSDATLGQTLATLGVDCLVKIDHLDCHIALTAGFPVDNWALCIEKQIRTDLATHFPTLNIQIQCHHFIKAHRTQLAGKGLRGIKNTIAVASGKGGVGKSTVTVNLAVALAQAGARVGILDADIYGPSIPMMLGKGQEVTVEDNHYLPAQAHGIQAMSIGYLTQSDEQALIWRGPMLAKSLLQMIDITQWDNLDYLFIDLPPGTGDIQLSLVQKIPLTSAIIVTTPQNIATLDAQKAIQLFERTQIDVLGLVENMATHTCSACGHQDAIFGEGGAEALCNRFNIPFLGQLPLNTLVRQHADQGQPISLNSQQLGIQQDAGEPWRQVALKMASLLAQKPINYADKFPPIVSM